MVDKPQDPQVQADAEAGDEEKQTSNLPENKVAVEDAGELRRKVTLTIPRERIDSKLNEMFGELGRTAQVPGFRIGRAPRRLVEKRFGKEVGEDVRNALIGESIGDAIEKSELKTLGEPDIDLEKIELPDKGEMSFSFEVEVSPEFDLPALKGIGVEKHIIEANDQRVDEELDRWRQEQASYEVTGEPAAEGDGITADVKIRGEEIDEFQSSGQILRVAPGQIEGLPLVELGEALAGRKAGESAELTVKVSDAHPNEQWRGKELNVEIAIGEVRRRILPEIGEEFAKSEGFESLSQLRRQISSGLQARLDMEVKRDMREQLRQYLLDNTELDLPAGLLKTYATRALRRKYVQLLNMGVPKEQIDESLTRLQADVAEQSRRDLKIMLIMNAIAGQKNVEVSDEEVNAGVAEMAGMYKRRPERLRQELEREGAMSAVSDSLRDTKVLDMLLADAEVTELPPPGEAAGDSAGDKKSAGKSGEDKGAENE